MGARKSSKMPKIRIIEIQLQQPPGRFFIFKIIKIFSSITGGSQPILSTTQQSRESGALISNLQQNSFNPINSNLTLFIEDEENFEEEGERKNKGILLCIKIKLLF